MPSHTPFEEAINRGYSAAHWMANQCADKLAGDAAKEAALSGCECERFREREKLSTLILSRLVDVVFHVAPDNASLSNTLWPSLLAFGRGQQGTLWMGSSAV